MARYVINQKFLAVPQNDCGLRNADCGMNGDSTAPSPALPRLSASVPPSLSASPSIPQSAIPNPHSSVLLAEMFGIGLDETYEVAIYEDLVLDVRPGDVVFVTGPSGSGKSVLLRRLAEAMRDADPAASIVDLAAVHPPLDRSVIDGLPCPFEHGLALLSSAGLADAFACLRRPGELSDGQRWRLRLAHALAQCGLRNADCGMEDKARRHEGAEAQRRNDGDHGTESLSFIPQSAIRNPHSVLLADEFCSTLDRLAARAIAYRVRRLATAHELTVLAASAHDDLVEDLDPDVLILKHEGQAVEVAYRNSEGRATA